MGKSESSLTRGNQLSEEAFWDKENGAIQILGQRHTAIDAQSLCDFLDSIVGIQVGEVIMHSLEFRLGKSDAARLKDERPNATLDECIEQLAKSDRLSGIGITSVTLAGNSQDSIRIEVTNPSVKGSAGAGKSFIFSWWAGALSSLLGSNFDVNGVVYNEEKNVIRCRIVPR